MRMIVEVDPYQPSLFTSRLASRRFPIEIVHAFDVPTAPFLVRPLDPIGDDLLFVHLPIECSIQCACGPGLVARPRDWSGIGSDLLAGLLSGDVGDVGRRDARDCGQDDGQCGRVDDGFRGHLAVLMGIIVHQGKAFPRLTLLPCTQLISGQWTFDRPSNIKAAAGNRQRCAGDGGVILHDEA